VSSFNTKAGSIIVGAVSIDDPSTVMTNKITPPLGYTEIFESEDGSGTHVGSTAYWITDSPHTSETMTYQRPLVTDAGWDGFAAASVAYKIAP
jgi:hypothetical protein